MRRHRRYPARSTGTGFTVFIVVIILAVAVGYAGTKYIIYPYMLGNGQAKASDNQTDGTGTTTDSAVDTVTSVPSIIIDQQNLKNTTSGSIVNPETSDVISQSGENLKGPFSVQFGSFTTKSGADGLSEQLSGKGIYSYVYETDGSYKVLGLPYSSEEKAKEAAGVVSSVVPDVFVVNLSTLIQ
ncbi:MAG: SPOR domain-containing protein [Bacillota bacterium]